MKNVYKISALMICLIISTLSTKVNAQHFYFVGGDPSSPLWTIYISEAVGDGMDLEAGDEIAIFDDDVMVGAFILDQVCTPDNVFDNDLIAFSMLEGGLQGYISGNSFTFIAWDQSAEHECTMFDYTFLDPYGDAYTGDVFPQGEGQYSMGELTFDCTVHPAVIECYPTLFCLTVAINGTAQDFLNIHSGSCGALEWNIEVIYLNKFENKNAKKEPDFSKENWLSVDPDAGVLPSGATEVVTLTFDAVNLEEGIYYADIHIFNNSVNNPEVIIPVTMTVVSPWGTQVFDLEAGFQFVSSTFDPTAPDMLVVMSDILNDNLDFVRNTIGQTLRKIGPNWVNGIGDWIIEEGYLIKMFAEDSFLIEGIPIDPSSPFPVETGFQFVSYFPEIPMDALNAFATIIGNNLDFIRNSQGLTLRKIGPNWVNGIGDCQPGEGYLVKMYANDILLYPFTCGYPFTDPRDGQTYNTVLIGDQCWMAENLNIGEMINGSENMTDNGVIEKYCYDNNPSICEVYGGLYQWNEMMEYVTDTAVQGICPEGWHLPTDHEWKILEGTVDSQYSIGDSIWNQIGNRGFDSGLNLKSSSGWRNGGNGSGLYGYEALPGGRHSSLNGNFYSLSIFGHFWSSTEVNIDLAWRRKLYYDGDGVHRYNYNKSTGISNRCVKDNSIIHLDVKSPFDDLADRKNKNSLPDHFLFEGGNPADPVFTIYIDGLEIGDEIAAFDGDILVGATQINSQNIFDNELPVFSTLNSGLGFTPGNPLILKVWNKNENQEYILNTYTSSNPYGDAWTENVFPNEDGEYSILHFSTTGISNENVINEISVYPNPTTGIIAIGNLSGFQNMTDLEITDITGKIVYQSKIINHQSKMKIDLSRLEKGVYFISFSRKDFNQVEKIVIQ